MSKRDGKTEFDINGLKGVLCYDWEALSSIEDDDYLKDKYQDLERHMRPNVIAKLLEIGFKRYSPDVSMDDIMKASPPIYYCFEKINEALIYSYFGNKEIPEPEESDDKKKTS